MKAIIISASTRTIREVDIKKDADGRGYLTALQSAVGGYIELVRINDDEDLYVNEEGLLHGEEHFFQWEGASQPFAGNGIIVGTDGEGGQCDTKLTAEYVRSKVRFVKAVVRED